MARIYIQSSPCVLSTTASIAASGSISGSAFCAGYARLIGQAISSGSFVAGSGIRVQQSMDFGANWDTEDDFALSACSGSTYSASLCGNAVKVTLRVGTGDAAILRAQFRLMPIW